MDSECGLATPLLLLILSRDLSNLAFIIKEVFVATFEITLDLNIFTIEILI